MARSPKLLGTIPLKLCTSLCQGREVPLLLSPEPEKVHYVHYRLWVGKKAGGPKFNCTNQYAPSQRATYTSNNASFCGNVLLWLVRRATGIRDFIGRVLGGADPLTSRRPGLVLLLIHELQRPVPCSWFLLYYYSTTHAHRRREPKKWCRVSCWWCDETSIAMHACFETNRLSAPRTDDYNIHFPLLVKKKTR